MGRSLLAAAGTVVTPATNNNLGLGNAYNGGVGSGGRALSQVKIGVAGAISNLAMRSTSGSCQTTLENNGSLTSLTVTASGAVAYDNTHTVSISAGDLVDMYVNVGSANITFVRTLFSATSNHAAIWAGSSQAGITPTAGSTNYLVPIRSGNFKATEANSKVKLRAGGTVSKAHIYVSANAASSSSTLRSRVNGSNGNITITIGAGLTGLFEDTSNSDTVAAGDDFGFSLVTGATSTITYNVVGVTFVNTASAVNDVFAQSAATGTTRAASGTATFYTILGGIVGNATESAMTIQSGFGALTSRLRLYVSANTYSGSATVVLRKNGADATQTFTISAGATGLFEDTTHIDAIADTDDICVSVNGGSSGSITLEWLGLTMTDGTLARSQAIVFA